MTMQTEESTVLVSITPRAAVRAKELLEQKGMADGSLRVFVVGGGCSGYQYGMALAREAETDDTDCGRRRRAHPHRPRLGGPHRRR